MGYKFWGQLSWAILAAIRDNREPIGALPLLDFLATKDIYPEEDSLRVSLAHMKKNGWVYKTDKEPCCECGHGRVKYGLTEDGLARIGQYKAWEGEDGVA